jgi:hypothetical protein
MKFRTEKGNDIVVREEAICSVGPDLSSESGAWAIQFYHGGQHWIEWSDPEDGKKLQDVLMGDVPAAPDPDLEILRRGEIEYICNGTSRLREYAEGACLMVRSLRVPVQFTFGGVSCRVEVGESVDSLVSRMTEYLVSRGANE